MNYFLFSFFRFYLIKPRDPSSLSFRLLWRSECLFHEFSRWVYFRGRQGPFSPHMFIFRDLKKFKDAKKQFDKVSEEKEVALVKNAQVPRNKLHEVEEATNILTTTRKCFRHIALDYVLQVSHLDAFYFIDSTICPDCIVVQWKKLGSLIHSTLICTNQSVKPLILYVILNIRFKCEISMFNICFHKSFFQINVLQSKRRLEILKSVRLWKRLQFFKTWQNIISNFISVSSDVVLYELQLHIFSSRIWFV